MTTEALVQMLALIGLVIVIASLLSGFVERTNFPQVAVFLGIGFALGPHGFGLMNIGLDSPILRVVATLSLTLVLFTDALTVNLEEVKKHAVLATVILVPGTLAATAIIAMGGSTLLGLGVPAAAMLAAALASTDPVLLRGFIRRPDLPSSVRQALKLESGLNDVVLLPVILIAMALLTGQSGEDAVSFPRLMLNMLVLGPGAGVVVALVAIKSLIWTRKRYGVRRDYESLFSLGVAFAAFALAEAMHGSGYLAAFAAGITIAALDVELCDCFREYGETTGEMMLLFTFVLLGGSLIWVGLGMVSVALVGFVLIALLARPVSLFFALKTTKTDLDSRKMIAWFGPRGLSSLLLILVPVFEKTPGSEQLFYLASVVVLASVVLHGGSIMAFARRRDGNGFEDELRMTILDLKGKMDYGEPVWLLDVRSPNSFNDSPHMLKGSVRLDPQQVVRTAEEQGVPKDAWAALFCT
jgi:NhaP-type Na+/H+ or K+/H+ antiporter